MVSKEINISVAICTYNGEKYLTEQLDSILQQSISVNEIIVCDDGSTDKTLAILKEYQRRNPSLFNIIQNPQNIGYVDNFEKAINHCSGDLFFLCDQDDIWRENKVEITLDYLKKNPEKNVFCHDLELLFDKGNISKSESFWNSEEFNTDFDNYGISEYLLYKRNVFPGMTMAITKEAKNKYLPLKKVNSIIIHDYEIVLKSCNDEKFIMIPEVLSAYRIHDGQNIGFSNSKKQKDNLSEIYDTIKRLKFVENTVASLNLNPKLYSNYKKKCRSDYKQFINKLSFPKNIITHLKMKYYYKILTFLE